MERYNFQIHTTASFKVLNNWKFIIIFSLPNVSVKFLAHISCIEEMCFQISTLRQAVLNEDVRFFSVPLWKFQGISLNYSTTACFLILSKSPFTKRPIIRCCLLIIGLWCDYTLPASQLWSWDCVCVYVFGGGGIIRLTEHPLLHPVYCWPLFLRNYRWACKPLILPLRAPPVGV
jgi:hypothetical protein